MGKYSNIMIPKILVDCEYYDDIPHMRCFKKKVIKSLQSN